MGMNVDATLAYGYDLGTDEDPKFAEKGEYGQPELPWFDSEAEDDDEGEKGFVEQMFNHLYAQIDNPPPAEYDFQRQKIAEEHYGIGVQHSGSHEYTGYILTVPDIQESVDWSDTLALDPAVISEPRPEWDARLATVIRILGITPTQDGLKWLVFPSYG
ncbi:hypothetical protein Ade02nite_21070 [Paractinoplanes deccanensis]|uniref:Uncharacterized protein n=1 Tax=Paractinoplanes deccanensis TaxID=113561 RepID=A0ABQ3Y0G6_9ACTN|nr:hypothetical protein [Actinoplanes deccanensis]GID73466.1 hypothetical protein Ade02nite_21070 [Actinoplanes deccanensis]